MKKALASVVLAALAMSVGASAALADDNDFRVYWKEGIRAETADGNFKWKLGGRLMYDAAFFSQDSDSEASFGEIDDGSEFRRARLALSGKIYERFIFKTQYDFADGDTEVKDAYLGITDLPCVGTVRLGQTKEPFSLDELTSSKYIEFMERGLTTVFAPSRNPGIHFINSVLDDRMTYAFAGSWDAGDSGNTDGEGTWSLTGRVTGLPWYQEKDQFLHVGVSLRYTNVSGEVRFRARPESHLSKRVADTGGFDADYTLSVAPEAAFVYGPFSLQGEYAHVCTDASAAGDPSFGAYTFSASYWLTGESRRFKKDKAEFDRVRPNNNFLQAGGLGAWQIALRYSNLQLSDEGISGGDVSDVTVGLNWQWNPNMRTMFNYVHSDVEDTAGVDSSMDIFQIRWQVDF